MKKKVLRNILPLVVLATMAAGCASKEAVVEPTEIVAEATEVTATEETEATETEDTETEVIEETETEELPEETETEGNTEDKNTEKNAESKTETSSSSNSSSSSQNVSSSQSTPASSESSSTSSESSSNSSSSSSSSSTSDSNTGDNSDNGNSGGNSSDVQFSGSVTLPNLGITIKTPNQYNSNGNLYTEIGDNADAFTNAVNQTLIDAQGMAWVGNAYGFYVMGYNSTPCSQITYNGDGTYTLVIGSHFGGGYSSYASGVDITRFNADAIICELATMSSTPMSVYNMIYEMNYGQNADNYNTDTWYSAGDCKIKCSSHGSFDPMSEVWTIKKN